MHKPLTAVALALAVALVAFPDARADDAPDVTLYDVQIDSVHPDPQLNVTIQFKIKRAGGDEVVTDVADEIRVTEDGQPVAGVELFRPNVNPLTTVLTLDTSGSMVVNNKMGEAREAARLFLDKLSPRSDCGLILFDHEMRVQEPPAGGPSGQTEHRQRLRSHIDTTEPRGGTAYLDATAHAVAMLRESKGRRAVLLMTDGVDLNSDKTLDEVIDVARKGEVPVYTIGVGEPGRNEPVTTVLVLDRSGSMSDPADNRDRVKKIQALRTAATKFVKLMRPGTRTLLIPFSNKVENYYGFSDNKDELERRISRLQAQGETRLYDAVYEALRSLDAAGVTGKRHVVVLTDGMDNLSNRRVEEVIELALQIDVPLTTLGLGRDHELDAAVLRRMAEATHGKYYHIRNQQELIHIFEQLSIDWHDDGIDEASLQRLAKETGGKYYRAADVKDLPLYFRELADELQTTYTVTFQSHRPSHDGTVRGIDISIWHEGKRISNVGSTDYKTSGVIVPEMNARVYLLLLALLGVLLALPAGVRRLYRPQVQQ